MMFSYFALAVLSLTVPPLIAVLVTPRLKAKAFFYGPVSVTLTVGLAAVIASLLRNMPYGLPKYLVVTAAAPALAWALCRFSEIKRPWPERKVFTSPRVWLCFVMAFVFVADSALILSRQDWGIEEGHSTYIRPPFNNDVQRHTILVAGLLRGGESPFLPGTHLTYQVFWYQLVAVYAWFFDGPTLFPAILGATLATLLLLSCMLAWAFARFRPGWGLHLGGAAAFLGMALAHIDLYHMVNSLMYKGVPGIEADWSFPPGLFRCFSLKLMMLTAPQHSLFFAFLIVYLVGGSLAWLRRLAFVLAFLASPVLLGFFFIPYYAYFGIAKLPRFREWLKFIAESVGIGIVAGLLYWGIMGLSPVDLFERPGNPTVDLRPWLPQYWPRFPLVWVASTGLIALMATVLFVHLLRGHRRRLLLSWPSVLFWAGTIVFNYILTSAEVRRHFAMVACFAGSLLVLRALPSIKWVLKNREWRFVAAGMATIAIPMHAYFIHSYAFKPSHLDPTVRWRDYFEMNRVVRRKFPGLRIVAAVDFKGTGLDYPIIMEATTSFSESHHAAVHVKLNHFQHMTLLKMNEAHDTVAFAKPLGYEALMWGPVERGVWGEESRRRFIREENLMAKVGEVSLYRLQDNMVPVLLAEKKKGGEDIHLRLARVLRDDGWRSEAIDEYLKVIHKLPTHGQARLEVSRLLYELGFMAWAKQEYEAARQLLGGEKK